jgi:hypothetical protein
VPRSPRRSTPLSAERRSERARKARLVQSYPPGDPKIIESDRKLNALRLQDYIEATLAESPPLSDEQRSKLAELLKPARDAVRAERLAELDASGAS